MLYRDNPKNGDRLSALGLGCLRLPKKGASTDMESARGILLEAMSLGINYIDTAYIYGDSEKSLGSILSDGMRDHFRIATKLPLFFVHSEGDIDKYFGRQLVNLKTDRVDYYLMHMLTSVTAWETLKAFGIERWIERKKASGAIGSIGFSYHGGNRAFAELLTAYDWDFVQIQYNYMDEHNQAGREGLELAESLGIPVVVMGPLRGGTLTNSLPPPARKIFEAAGPSVTPAEWALRWVLNHPGVTVTLSGMTSASEVAENCRISGSAPPGCMSAEELRVVSEARAELEKLIKVPCTGCGYCLPCPFGVDIPGCFTARNSYEIDRSLGNKQYFQITGQLGPTPSGASNCRKCGRCEPLCPQSIPIISALQETAVVLEPLLTRAKYYAARRFLKVKTKKPGLEAQI